jgi:hypothetical protein
MIRYVVVAVTLIGFAVPALAAEEWYVSQDPNTKICKKTRKKPDGSSAISIGSGPYPSEDAAVAAMAAAPDCKKKS